MLGKLKVFGSGLQVASREGKSKQIRTRTEAGKSVEYVLMLLKVLHALATSCQTESVKSSHRPRHERKRPWQVSNLSGRFGLTTHASTKIKDPGTFGGTVVGKLCIRGLGLFEAVGM